MAAYSPSVSVFSEKRLFSSMRDEASAEILQPESGGLDLPPPPDRL